MKPLNSNSAETKKLLAGIVKEAGELRQAEVLEHFKRWATNPHIRDWICQNWLSPEERERRLREIFYFAPDRADAPATEEPNSKAEPLSNQTEPDSIQANPTKSK